MKRIPTIALMLVFVLFGCTTKTTSNVSSIQIIPGNTLLSLTLTRSFTAIALDANGNALNIKNFTWASSDQSVASVNDGQVTAKKLGSSQLTASANSITSAPVSITVLEAVGTVSSTNASDLMPVLLLGRRLISAIGLNPSKFTFPKPPLATDLETTPFGSTVTVSGDNGDNDGDGLPNDVTSTFAGTYKHLTQAALTYSGMVRTQDASTVSGIADVSAEFNNLKLDGTVNTQPYSYTLNGRQSLKNNGTRNDSMTLTSNATLDLIAFGRNSTLEFANSAQFVPDDASDPLAGGTLDWQDTIKTNLAGNTKILLERGEGVHIGTCGQYDSGRIVILDSSASTNVLEFGPGCGEVQLTRDGNSLVPTLGGTVTISPLTASLKYSQTQQFTATALSIAGETIPLPTGSVTWNSSAATIAIIGTNGLATAQSITGNTSITATAYGKTSSPVTLSVSAPAVATISVSPLTASIPFNGTQVFTATAKDALGTTIPGVTFTWSSSAPSVAIIGADGLATAQSIIGSTNIMASAFGKTSNTVVLSVTAPTVDTITITPVTASITVGGMQTFTATAKDVNGIAIPGVTFVWNSSLPTIASIGLTTGIATGVAIGTSSITASTGGKTSSLATLMVTAAPDFTLTSLPTPLALGITRIAPAAATTALFSGTVTAVAGLTGSITYSLDPITTPVGVTLTPPVTPVVLGPAPVISPMTLNVAASVPANTVLKPNYTFNLIATNTTIPTLKHTIPITLTVTGP
jgi:uncharacterized protein YjdB